MKQTFGKNSQQQNNDDAPIWSVRTNYDFKGNAHRQVRVPSHKGLAWIEILEDVDREFEAEIFNPTIVTEAKQAFLWGAYLVWRQRENKRKRKEAATDTLAYEPSNDRRIQNAEWYADPAAKLIETETVEAILGLLDPSPREYFRLWAIHGWGYVDIARDELPDTASQGEVNKRADAIRKIIARAKTRLKNIAPSRPDLFRPEGV